MSRMILSIAFVLLLMLSVSNLQAQELRFLGDTGHGGAGVDANEDYMYCFGGGIEIISLADFENLEVVSSYDFGRGTNGVVIGDYAYTCDENSIFTFDVSDPQNPDSVYCFGYDVEEFTPTFISIYGNYAYVNNGADGWVIVDISDPQAFSQVYTEQFDRTPQRTIVRDNIAFFTGDDRFYAYNIEDMNNPERVGELEVNTNYQRLRDFAICGNYAFLPSGWDGIRVINISDPASMEEVAHLQGGFDGVAAFDHYFLAISGALTAMLYDISNPEEPELVTQLQYRRQAEMIEIRSNRAFFCGDGGTTIIDLSDYLNVEPSIEILAPVDANLIDAYPNPFNSATFINFNTVSSGAVSLEIYNLSGQRVSSLYDGTLSQGSHSLSWNAAGLPAGSYIVRLTGSNGLNATNRVILLK